MKTIRNIASILFVALGALLLYTSCHRSNQVDVKECQFELDNAEKRPLVFTDKFHSVQIIPLENKRECMLTYVLALSVTKKGYVVMTDYGNHFHVFNFDKDGKYIKRIGQIGRAKSEYQILRAMAASPSGDSIALVTESGINLYDGNGRYLDTKSHIISSDFKNIQATDRGFVCSTDYSGAESLLYFFDDKFTLQESALPTNGFATGYQPIDTAPIQADHTNICYYDFFTSTFHLFDSKTLQLKKEYKLHSGNTMTLQEIPEKIKSSPDGVVKYSLNGCKIEGILSYQKKQYTFELDTEADTFCLYERDGWFPAIYNTSDGYSYSIMSAEDLRKILSIYYMLPKETYKMLKDAYDKLGKEINDGDNHVILIMK